MRMTSLARSAVFQVSPDVVFGKKLVPKARCCTLWSFWTHRYHKLWLVGNWKQKIMCYAIAKHEIEYWKHISHWNRKVMKNENPEIFKDIDQLYTRSTRQFWQMLPKLKFPIFQISGFYSFLLLKNIKSTKNPQHSNLCTLLHYL